MIPHGKKLIKPKQNKHTNQQAKRQVAKKSKLVTSKSN